MPQNERRRKVEIPRRKSSSPSRPVVNDDNFIEESVAILLAVLGVFIGVALYSYLNGLPDHVSATVAAAPASTTPNTMGWIGEVLAQSLVSLLGYCSFVTVVWALLLAKTIWTHGWPRNSGSVLSLVTAVLGSVLMAAACATIASVLFGFAGGGKVGSRLGFILIRNVNEAGALLISFATLLMSFALATGVGISRLFAVCRLSLKATRVVIGDSMFFCRQIGGLFYSGKMSPGAAGIELLQHFGSLLLSGVVSLLKFPAVALRLILRRKLGDRNEEYDDGERRPDERPFVLGRGSETGATTRERGARKRDTDRHELPVRKSSRANLNGDLNTDLSDIAPKISRGIRADDLESLEKRKTAEKGIKKLLHKRRRKENGNADITSSEPPPSKPFELPPAELLVAGETVHTDGPQDSELIRNSNMLEKALVDFKIGGRIVEVHPGPVITLYEFEPAPGVKVQRIVSLADDLALALRVASVRVYAPVPGKGTVGIEVPNASREIVRLRDVLASQSFIEAESSLTLAIGKDTFGEPFSSDLSKMPHLLIAGATGTGKSVCINSLILSLLYRNTPEQLRFLMIDPKMLELSVYEGIPHLKAPVVTNPKRARGVLWWAVEEMERRYRLMKELGVRHLSNYNRAVDAATKGRAELAQARASNKTIIELSDKNIIATGAQGLGLDRSSDLDELPISSVLSHHERLPRIVILVDELADLMLTVGREIEELLTRLAQKARASGIHLILATQRPSVNVITGLIKANFPARMSFQVASRIDARTVMDASGAERLLGQGDMLFLAQGTGRVRRLHSAFVSDKEVQDVARWLREQGEPDYDPAIEQMIERVDQQEQGGTEMGETEYDPLYDQALKVVIEKGAASTSMVQRVFRIGYNRAARILETMEREGIVGPADGARPRQVLAPNRDLI